jgi:hypothetical protein
MLKRTLLIFAVLCAAILVGCNKTDSNENSNTAAGNSNKATTTTSPATTTTTSTTGEKIGIPECDDFITKYDACVSAHVPEAQRAQYKESLTQWRKTWRQLAENPMTKGTLAAACKQAAAEAKTSMKSYNCDF